MIKILFTSALVSFLAMSSEQNTSIFHSENAVADHLTKDGRGIQNCKKEMLEVTKDEAVKKDLHLCGRED